MIPPMAPPSQFLFALVCAVCALLPLRALDVEGPQHVPSDGRQAGLPEVHEQLPSIVNLDWTVVDGEFFLEVKNSTAQPFTLDAFFVEGFNVEIIGMDDTFRAVYRTEFGVLIERAPPVVVVLKPGTFHRTPFRIDHLQKTTPKNVKYIIVAWTLNEQGTTLPKGGLKTTLYELRRVPQIKIP
jgi:hypothetical protein